MKRAVVLFNLGGPDAPEAVRPFLFNLFNDAAIIDLPGWLRWLLARLISGRRAKTARAIYDHIGGKSPLLERTQAQAGALQNALAVDAGETRVFIAMRYWHPMTEAAVQAVQEFGADEILLLPLYPQFSTTTTQSSLDKWHRCARAAGLTAPSYGVCCYPAAPGLIAAQARLLGAALAEQSDDQPMRVLFSAHGLPEKIVAKEMEGVRVVAFGHLGDGNIHFNLSPPEDMDADAFLGEWQRFNRLVHDLVHDLDGSFSAEHGIGTLKKDDLVRYRSAVELELMKALKQTLDPKGIMNPGKVL